MKNLIQQLKKELEIFIAKSEFYKQVYIFFEAQKCIFIFSKIGLFNICTRNPEKVKLWTKVLINSCIKNVLLWWSDI